MAAGDLDDATLRTLALGGGPYLLVESPFSPAIGAFEPLVLDLLERGHRVLLAHPERCPAFQRDPERLQRLVDAGRAGADHRGLDDRRLRLDRAAPHRHDAPRRRSCTWSPPTPTTRSSARPASATASPALERELPGLAELQPWMTEQVPRAILDGTPLPERPPLPTAGRPPAPARAQSLTIAITMLASTHTTISTCIQ